MPPASSRYNRPSALLASLVEQCKFGITDPSLSVSSSHCAHLVFSHFSHAMTFTNYPWSQFGVKPKMMSVSAPYQLRTNAKRMIVAARHPFWMRDGTVQPKADRVLAILLTCCVLKIARAVVGLTTISMINGQISRARPDEGSGYQLMNFQSFTHPILANADARVAIFIADILTNVPSLWMPQHRFVAAYATKIRDGIIAFVTNHITPFFRFKFFGGKFWSSQGVNLLRLGLALVRLVQVFPHLSEPLCFRGRL